MCLLTSGKCAQVLFKSLRLAALNYSLCVCLFILATYGGTHVSLNVYVCLCMCALTQQRVKICTFECMITRSHPFASCNAKVAPQYAVANAKAALLLLRCMRRQHTTLTAIHAHTHTYTYQQTNHHRTHVTSVKSLA